MNKVQLRSKIEINQQLALKCMQFATEFMLKKAEYRLLNPLHFDHMNRQEVVAQSELMAELSMYSVQERNLPKMKKSRMNSSSIKKNQSTIRDKESPQSPKKQSPTLAPNQKQPSGLLQINEFSLKSKITSDQYKTPPVSSIPPIKPTTSYFIDDSLILKQQSNIKPSVPVKPSPVEFSSDQDARSNASSKKSKKKFEKVPIHSKKPQQKDQTMPNSLLSFKKKPTPHPIEQKSFAQSPIIKKTQSDKSSDDDDFDNYPLAKSNNKKKDQLKDERASLNSSDFDSYHSSILSDAKKIEIHVVSEHASENDISVISHKRRQQIVKGQSTKVSAKGIKQNGQRVGLKKSFSHNGQPSSRHQNPMSQIRQSSSSAKDPSIINDQIPLYSNHQSPQIFPEQTPQQPTPSSQQISNYLMKMQSFEVQQEMLMKKLMKVWGRESKCIRDIKQIKWEDLQLPKPKFQVRTYQYAQVIQ